MSSLETNGSREATDFNCGGLWIVGRQPADVLVRLILTDIIIYFTTAGRLCIKHLAEYIGERKSGSQVVPLIVFS